jgi:amidase
MMALSRRRFLEAGAALSALAACKTGSTASARPWADGVAQAAAVREGRIKPIDLVNTAIARLDAVNARINAVRLPNYDRARAAAVDVGRRPLAGVPTLIKDNIHQLGLPYTQGCRALAGNIAQQTDPYAAAIERAGLISIGRSTLPEFGLTATTEPLLTGPARNPWNLDHSTGGSSGGSAAAVAAGVVAVAHANDGGGSIRIPAAHCGLVGLKPSRRRMVGDSAPDRGVELAVEGCVSRTVRDTAAWFAATQARGAGTAFVPADLVTGPSSDRLRVGLRVQHPLGTYPDEDVQRVFGDTAALLVALGHVVRDVQAPYQGDVVIPAFLSLWESGARQVVDEISRLAPDADPTTLLEPLTLGMAEVARGYTPAHMERAARDLDAAMASYRDQFAEIDVYVTPVLGKVPQRIGYIAPTIPWPDQRDRLIEYAGYTGIENVAGVPSIALPIGESQSGLPVGIQFTAPAGAEARLLALAYELERQLLWYDRRPPAWVGDLEA